MPQTNPEATRSKLAYLIQSGICGLDQIQTALRALDELSALLNMVTEQNKQLQEQIRTLQETEKSDDGD